MGRLVRTEQDDVLSHTLFPGPGDLPLYDKYQELKNNLTRSIFEAIFPFIDELDIEGLSPTEQADQIERWVKEALPNEDSREFRRFANRFNKCLMAGGPGGCGHTDEDHAAMLHVWEHKL